MIEIMDLCKSFNGHKVYEHLNLSIEEAKITSLLGPSGCGKTTLLRMIAGLEPYESGKILGLKNKRIAYMFQEDYLMPWLNVERNIAYILKSKYNSEQIEEKIKYILEVLQLSAYRKHAIHELSGGMKRRIALGRALVYESDLLLLDEPFKGLDDGLKESLYPVLLEETKKAKRTIICVTHDVKEAHRLGEVIYLKPIS